MPRKRIKKVGEPFGILYLITNKIDGKRYIGQTTDTLEQRWAEHCWDNNGCRYLKYAIQSISRAARENRTSAGFHWKYV